MRTKHLFVLIHIRNNGDVGTIIHKPYSENIFTDVPRRCFLVGYFCYLLLSVLLLSFLFLQPCGHLLGKGWRLGSLVCDVFLCFCHFPTWCPGSGVVLDCIDF